jgi:hypothetical protein
MKPILHLFKLQRIAINVFNTVNISVFGSTSPIYVTGISGAVANYTVDQKYSMLLNVGVYFRSKIKPPLRPLLSQLSTFQILDLKHSYH